LRSVSIPGDDDDNDDDGSGIVDDDTDGVNEDLE
jgi:hypothetical protein